MQMAELQKKFGRKGTMAEVGTMWKALSQAEQDMVKQDFLREEARHYLLRPFP